MHRVAMSVLIALLFSHQVAGSQGKFGKDGFHFNLGISIIGPEVSLGDHIDKGYGEWYFAYHAIDWETNEKLWNKPTSGGWILGVNYFPMYWGEYSSWRWKWLLGFGAGLMKERLGREAYGSVGDPTEGSWKWYELHTGVRFFATERLSITAWVGYMVSQDNSDSMLKKHPQYGITETMAKLSLDASILYTF
jgi:hypothetical protein